jgi:hypothetical protein
MQRIDAIKTDFNGQVKKLADHFVKARNDAELQQERKIELLKAEIVKGKNDFAQFRAMQERQCMCKYYEETLAKTKEENIRFLDKLKANYQKDLDEYRGRYDDLKIKIALDINDKTLHFIKDRHGQYFESFCAEKKLE